MVYKNFRLNCIFRILFITLSIFLLFFLILNTKYVASAFVVGMIIIIQVVDLIRYVEKTNKYLKRFLDTVKYSDFTQSFSEPGLGTSFDDLKIAFTGVIEEFRKARSEKEEHFRYLQTVVKHVGIGLMSFTEDGKIELINPPAKKLLNMGIINNVRDLNKISSHLVETLFKMKSGENQLVKIVINSELLQLAVYATELKMKDQRFKLVSLQNIHSELEEKELESWHKLIRVLTHEIMNSMTPISSLASTIYERIPDIYDKDGKTPEQNELFDEIEDLRMSARTIQKRSTSLMSFINSYRNLTLIPKPEFKIILISDMINHITQLMKKQFEERSIKFTCKIEPESLELTADPELVEQVLINLLKNSLQALENKTNPVIGLSAHLDKKGKIVIQVFDNGPGINEEISDKIFIPFYTTKKKGSGIGLSLSRQIMRLHKGTITVHSRKDAETIFTLKF